jgi:DtxR family Mn-dependent transcriptional regulator
MIAVLGDPKVCPHGLPIPPADGSPPPRPDVPLAQILAGSGAVVYGVTEEVPEILRYLAEIGLRPGVPISVVEKAPLGGPVTVKVNGQRHAISLELARMITVVS